MVSYGDFGPGRYVTLITLPVVIALPAGVAIPTVKPSQPVTPTPRSPALSNNSAAVADQTLNDSAASQAVIQDQTDNNAFGALTVPNPLTGV